MTKKDYEMIATALRGCMDRVKSVESREKGIGLLDENQRLEPFRVHLLIIQELADALEADNPRFDRDKFVDNSY